MRAEIRTTLLNSIKNRRSIETLRSLEILSDKPRAAYAMKTLKITIALSTYHVNTSSTATASENGCSRNRPALSVNTLYVRYSYNNKINRINRKIKINYY